MKLSLEETTFTINVNPKVEQLKSIVNTIRRSGVNKALVLSAEDIVGNMFITKDKPINRYSDELSDCNLTSTITNIQDEIKKLELDDIVTYQQVHSLLKETVILSNTLVAVLDRIAATPDYKILKALCDETYAYTYTDYRINKETTKVYNIAEDYTIIEALRYDPEYINKAIASVYGETKAIKIYDRINAILERYNMNASNTNELSGQMDILPLYSCIVNNTLPEWFWCDNDNTYADIVPVNIKNLLTTMENIVAITENYKVNVHKRIDNDYNTLANAAVNYSSNNGGDVYSGRQRDYTIYLKDQYVKYRHIKSVLSDRVSLTMFDILDILTIEW